MRLGCLVALAMAACSFDPSGIGGGSSDGSPVGDGSSNDGQGADARIGPDGPPLTGLDLSGGNYVYNTNSETFTTVADPVMDPPTTERVQGGTPALVIGVGFFRLRSTASLRVVGDRPLIIDSMSTIDIEGTLDVSTSKTERGAGANPDVCGAQDGITGLDDSAGAPGGGGGALGGDGGQGGTGDTNQSPTAGALGGTALATPPTIVRGGCRGGDGGDDDLSGGDGGDGGGAIMLLATGTLTVSGTVHAGGAGGIGGTNSGNAGGGGGGSGGLISLDGPTVIVSGTLAANGGGGGEGSRVLVQMPDDGDDGGATADRANGGAGGVDNPQGGDGGDGGAQSVDGLTGGGGEGGGGGGGGGSGLILIKTNSLTTGGSTISPNPIEL